MSAKKSQQKSVRRQVELILKVRSGQITATEAAREMGISRKTYYKWETRALEGMVNALEERPNGRPQEPPPDPEKEKLKFQLEQEQKKNATLEQRLNIHRIIGEMSQDIPPTAKKK